MSNNHFNEEQIEAAKAVRDHLIKENVQELKSVYMAGEIVMWVEMQPLIEERDKEIAEWKEECDRLAKIAEYWQTEYNKIIYEQNKDLPGFNSPKIDNL